MSSFSSVSSSSSYPSTYSSSHPDHVDASSPSHQKGKSSPDSKSTPEVPKAPKQVKIGCEVFHLFFKSEYSYLKSYESNDGTWNAFKCTVYKVWNAFKSIIGVSDWQIGRRSINAKLALAIDVGTYMANQAEDDQLTKSLPKIKEFALNKLLPAMTDVIAYSLIDKNFKADKIEELAKEIFSYAHINAESIPPKDEATKFAEFLKKAEFIKPLSDKEMINPGTEKALIKFFEVGSELVTILDQAKKSIKKEDA